MTKKHKLIQTKLFEDKPITKSKKNRKLLLLIAIIVTLLIVMIYVNYGVNNGKQEKSQDTIKINPGEIQVKDDSKGKDPTIVNPDTSSVSSKENKPSFIVFAGTYCGHCRVLIPELEKEIWDNYKDKVDIWVNVIDGQTGKTFPVTRIAQGFDPALSYDEIMVDCSYVPAYVVLDKDGKQVLRSCGSEKTIDDIKNTLNNLLD